MAIATANAPSVKDIMDATLYNPKYAAENIIEHNPKHYPKTYALGFAWDHLDYLLPARLIESIAELRMFDEDAMEKLVAQWAEENNWDYDTLIANLADASFVKDDIKLPQKSRNRNLQSKSEPVGYISRARREDAEDAIVDALDGMGLCAPGAYKVVMEAVMKALTE